MIIEKVWQQRYLQQRGGEKKEGEGLMLPNTMRKMLLSVSFLKQAPLEAVYLIN